MKYKKLVTITFFAVAVLVLQGIALAQAPATMPVYQLVTTVVPPGGLGPSFDISWVDPGSQLFYLADRTRTKGTDRLFPTAITDFLFTMIRCTACCSGSLFGVV